MAYRLVASTDYCWVGMLAEPLVDVMDAKKAAMTEMKMVGEKGIKSVDKWVVCLAGLLALN